MNKDILNKSVSPRLIALGRWGVKGCDGWWKTQKTHFHDNDLEDESFLCLEKLQHLFIYCQTDKLLLTFSSAPLAFTVTFLPLSLSLHSLKYTRSFTHSPHTHTHTLHTALFLNRATLRQCAAAEWILGKHWDIYLNIQFLAVCVFSIISLHIIAAPRLNSECWHALHVVVISDFFSELNTNLECTYHFELFLIFSFNISSFTVINIVVL